MSKSHSGIGPADFFSEVELKRIARCPVCTYVVYQVYYSVVEFLDSREMLTSLAMEIQSFDTPQARLQNLSLA